METNNTSTGTVLLALLGGAVLGAGVALLYAPQSGRRTRQRLREFGEDAGDSFNDLLGKAEDCLEEVKKRGEECMEEARSKGDEWLHKGHGCAVEKRQQAAAATGV